MVDLIGFIGLCYLGENGRVLEFQLVSEADCVEIKAASMSYFGFWMMDDG
jgi:hypothetical protein